MNDPRANRFSGGSLRGRAARGTLVNGAFLTLVNGLAVARGFVVAAFLTTAEYGTYGIIVVIVVTLTILRQVGISEKFVQQDEEDQERAFQLAFTFELVVAMVFVVVGAVAVLLLAEVYGYPEIRGPGLVLLLMIPFGALQAPLGIFYRRMDFARQRLLQAVDPVLAFVISVSLAAGGAGYWSIVIGSVAGAAAAAAVALIASPYRLRLRLDRGVARGYFDFSWPIFVAGLSAVVTGQGLTAAGTAKLGLSGFGIVILVSQVSQIADRADRAITETIYPAICAVKDRTDLLMETFTTSNRIALMWAVPFGAGVALFAHDLLVGALGEEWEPGVLLLQCTAASLAVHQIGFNWTAFYRARGDTKPIAVAGVVGIVTFLTVVLPLLLAFELDGLAAGIVISECVYLCTRLFFLRRIFPKLGVARHLWRAVVPVLPPIAAVLLIRLVADGGTAVLVAQLSVFLALVAGMTWTMERPLIAEAVGYLRRGASPAAPQPQPG